MYLGYLLLALNVPCYCFVGYDIFTGFDTSSSEEKTTKAVTVNEALTQNTTVKDSFILFSNVSVESTTGSLIISTATATQNTTQHRMKPDTDVKLVKFICPERAKPQNIGPYEVPSQRDLVFEIKRKLTTMFGSYHTKALYFLKDIKQAMLAADSLKNKCHGESRNNYINCIKKISSKYQTITKDLVVSLEEQRRMVANFSEKSICNIEQMKADPIDLIKTLAMEDASLEFALPGFLRLLSSCSTFCHRMSPRFTSARKPTRHMTDQQLVVKHFLTKKNYIQLIKSSNYTK